MVLAHGILTETSAGEVCVSEVILKPRITFHPHYDVSAEVIAEIHKLAHEQGASSANHEQQERQEIPGRERTVGGLARDSEAAG